MDELVGAAASSSEGEGSAEGAAASSGGDYKEITVTRDRGALTITLNRPKKYNAFNYQVTRGQIFSRS